MNINIGTFAPTIPSLFQEDWKRCGPDNFTYFIIEETSRDDWVERKQYYMDLFRSYISGYNIRPKADLSELAEDVKIRMSLAQLGEKNHMFGKKLSEERKKQISDATRGKNNPNYGKKHSDKTKRLISLKRKGSNVSEETKIKIVLASKGRKL